jgi:DNA-binding MarR family transcriptional regulator
MRATPSLDGRSGCNIGTETRDKRNTLHYTRNRKYETQIVYMTHEDTTRTWHFLTNHTQVLLCIARDPDVRLRDIAASVGITERATQRILSELVEDGFVSRERTGRRNCYRINPHARMRHPAQVEHEIGELLDLLTPPPDP